ncbi:CPBP family intramembrane glutamic endopeptidase [Undibacterium sp. TS12]|uniref:CPBP family intramembrane glutamic endopeptidase n=1 Tax=Undibacterium sp. TS12 TaxID=2908202 RepID=UPI001F4D068D|nr:CPBP family intramembrane glutamic endopeptidase [Undibacterium sp. TS12]MCH8620500.1 CPBP family intramembrane metalloprotease [Undibacterium sp. TS12]
MEKNDHLLFFATFFVFALNVIFVEFPIEKIPLWAACLLLLVSAIAFVRAEKRFQFRLNQLWQSLYPFIYLVSFSLFLYFSGYVAEISFEVSKHIDLRLAINIVAIAVGAAVAEEIFFRKFLLDLFQKTMSKQKALVLTSLAFFAAHFSTLPTFFLFGLFLGYLTLRYQSIVAAVTLHAMYDIVGFSSKNAALQAYKINDTISISELFRTTSGFALIISMLCLLLSIAIARIFNKIRKRHSESEFNPFANTLQE